MREQWTSKVGLPCLALKHPELGHWCGYVGIPIEKLPITKNLEDFSVHGGITFEEYGGGDHFPKGFYWIGFDCAHFTDIIPNIPGAAEGATYKDLDFVKKECERLAEQV